MKKKLGWKRSGITSITKWIWWRVNTLNWGRESINSLYDSWLLQNALLLILDFELQNDEKSAQVELRGAKSKLNNLQQEANDDMPAGLAGFEAAKEVRNFIRYFA